ncbi:hypothetical protein ACQKP0_25530 [Heyndrickxia sp. NPDC080065]|uniref:hypothetical protein n=1 Tax=Heyndrickxia sp. NPDC080065 TaxID=3390568 RepID=UPI003D02819D
MYLIEQQIKTLSEDGMFLLYKDVINRIGSHMVGGNPDSQYIMQQESILNLIQDELMRRK